MPQFDHFIHDLLRVIRFFCYHVSNISLLYQKKERENEGLYNLNKKNVQVCIITLQIHYFHLHHHHC